MLIGVVVDVFQFLQNVIAFIAIIRIEEHRQMFHIIDENLQEII